MSKEKPHIAIRILKAFGWTLLAISLLILLARLSLKTSVVHNFAKEKAAEIANQQLNATLTLGEINGDLWKHFSINELRLQQENTTTAFIDSVEVQYNIWSLLSGSFSASKVSIYGLQASIIETTDSTFNVQKLVKEPEQPHPEEAPGSFGINLEQIILENSSVYIQSALYLPDSTLRINQLQAQAGFSYANEISASLSSLSFKLKEGRLPTAIAVETSGAFHDKEITLNRLLIESSRSLLKANGVANLKDTALKAEVKAVPFSLKDLQPYLSEELPEEELQLTLKAGGTMDSLHVELSAESKGFDNFFAISDFSFSDAPTLLKFGVQAENIDLGYLTHDSLDASIQSLQATFEGRLNQNIAETDGTWGFTLAGIRYEQYGAEKLFGSGTLSNNELRANFQLTQGQNEIIANPVILGLFDEQPDWEIPVQFKNINPGLWFQNPDLDGNISLSTFVEGTGFELPEHKPWSYSIHIPPAVRIKPQHPDSALSIRLYSEVDTAFIGGQAISDLNFEGDISRNSITSQGLVKLIDDSLAISATVSNLLEDQLSFAFQLNTQQFNAAEVVGMEDFPTRINLAAKGSGRYSAGGDIQVQTQVSADSSYLNGAALDKLSLTANLHNNTLIIPQVKLKSEVADGTFSARRNISDRTDPTNRLTVDVQLKNLQPIADFIDAKKLSGTGTITGNVTDTNAKKLQFDGNIELHDVAYDSLFSAKSIVGKNTITIGEEYAYDLALDITKPAYTQFKLQDLHFQTHGTATPDSMLGNFVLNIESDGAGSITQSGNYRVGLDTLSGSLIWNQFNYQTPVSTLLLQRPFEVSYQNSVLQTDTLELRAEDGTFFELSVPYADSLRQHGRINGRDFNFGVIQEIIFDERFVDGVLSGNLALSNTPDSLSGNGAITINHLSYKGTDVDTLDLDFGLSSGRLKATLDLIIEDESKVSGFVDVPFTTNDPGTIDDAFFEEKVEGRFEIKPIALSELQSILNAFEIKNTKGIFTFNGSLSGTAGEPDFEGNFELKDPVLSGIKVDTAFADFSYHHQQKNITLKAGLNVQQQRAASIDASVPISMDFRTFELNMPEETDSIEVQILTDDFNISIANDFLDKHYLKNIKGLLNANIDLSGVKSELTPQGKLTLTKAEVEVPIAGIKLKNISSELNLSEKGLSLDHFSMESGSGKLTANGMIKTDGLSPVGIDIKADATRFKLANTADYNLTIDMDAALTGEPYRPKASGKLTVKNGFIYLQNFGEKSVENVELEEEETTSFSLYDSLAIDMEFEIERNFQIRNRRYLDMEVSLSGNLEAQKPVRKDLQLFGALTANDGFVRPLGKQFNIDEGRFTFSGPMVNPEIYIKTSYIPQTSQKQGSLITLFYIIEGSAQDPNFRFESEPTMEQQDIICYTLFNKPCYALDSWQQAISGQGGASPTDLLVGVLLDEFETLATQQLGIDVVQIDNNRSGGTSIKTGWYVNQKTFFAIINRLGGSDAKTLFVLEYLLKENLDLIITQGDDSRQGVDIRWQYDY